jgi:hypothetical protein
MCDRQAICRDGSKKQHDGSSVLFCQNQFILPRTAQAIGFIAMPDGDFILSIQ